MDCRPSKANLVWSSILKIQCDVKIALKMKKFSAGTYSEVDYRCRTAENSQNSLFKIMPVHYLTILALKGSESTVIYRRVYLAIEKKEYLLRPCIYTLFGVFPLLRLLAFESDFFNPRSLELDVRLDDDLEPFNLPTTRVTFPFTV